MLEANIVSEILERLGGRDDMILWRNNTGVAWFKDRPVKYGLVGSPDILGASKGWAFGIEVKRPGGDQSEAQKRFQTAWQSRGGAIYIVARSADEAEVMLSAALLDREEA